MVLLGLDENDIKNHDEEVNEMIADIGFKYLKLISFVDINYDLFMYWVDVVPYYKNVLDEGVVLYAA